MLLCCWLTVLTTTSWLTSSSSVSLFDKPDTYDKDNVEPEPAAVQFQLGRYSVGGAGHFSSSFIREHVQGLRAFTGTSTKCDVIPSSEF